MVDKDIKKSNVVPGDEPMKKEGPQGTNNQPSERGAEELVNDLTTQGLQEEPGSQTLEDVKDLSEQTLEATEETNDRLEEIDKQIESLKKSNNLGSTALKRGAVLGTAGALVGFGGLGLAPIVGMQYANDPSVTIALERFKRLEDDKWDDVLVNVKKMKKEVDSKLEDIERKATRNYVDGLNITLDNFNSVKNLLKQRGQNIPNSVDIERLNKTLDSVEVNSFITQSDMEQIKENQEKEMKLITLLKKELFEQQEDNRKLRRDLHNSVEFLSRLISENFNKTNREISSLSDDHYVLSQQLKDFVEELHQDHRDSNEIIMRHVSDEMNKQDHRNEEAWKEAIFEVTESFQKVKDDILIELGTDLQDIKNWLTCYGGDLMSKTDVDVKVKDALLKSPLCVNRTKD